MFPNIRSYPMIQYSNRLELQKKSQTKNSTVGTTIESAKQPNSSNAFENSKSKQYHHKLNINFQSWILWIKSKINVPIHKVHRSTNSVEKFMNQTASNSKVESTSTRTIPLTNRPNDKPNTKWFFIHFRNPYEN